MAGCSQPVGPARRWTDALPGESWWDFSTVEMRITTADGHAEADSLCVWRADRIVVTGDGMLADQLFTLCSMKHIPLWQGKCGVWAAKMACQSGFSGLNAALPRIWALG